MAFYKYYIKFARMFPLNCLDDEPKSYIEFEKIVKYFRVVSNCTHEIEMEKNSKDLSEEEEKADAKREKEAAKMDQKAKDMETEKLEQTENPEDAAADA